jgi:hypothetical protein
MPTVRWRKRYSAEAPRLVRLRGRRGSLESLADSDRSDFGLSERGLSERGLFDFGLSERGLFDFGLSERGLFDFGLSERGLPDPCDFLFLPVSPRSSTASAERPARVR